jgi:hypothetical protein
MASILTTADFIGEFELPIGQYVNTKIDLFIAQVQEDYLIDLLGYDLKTAFEAGIVATTSKYELLRDGDTYTNSAYLTKYKGIKEMLKYFTYYEYMRFEGIENTAVGLVQNETTNSEPAGTVGQMKIRRMYNRGVGIYYDTAMYINSKNSPTEQFALFLYTKKKKISMI